LKHFTLLRRLGYMLLTLGLLCGAVIATGAWRQSAPKVDEKAIAESYRQYHARIRDGVGREVELARGSSPAQIRHAVDSVAKFVERRSGVSLSEATKNRLATLEERVQSGNGRRLPFDAFSVALSATVLERFSSLNDQELARMDETLRGFNAPDMPKGYARDFKLPEGFVSIGIPPETTIGRLKAVRDGLNTPARDVFAAMFREKVLYNVKGKARNLAKAVPEHFGNLWDVTGDNESSADDAGFTPLQAFLFTYSLVSNDALDYSQANLRKYMEADQKYWTEKLGQPYPNPEGHHAYGVNGYLFSSPLDLIFDEQTINHLLDRIEKGGGV
jgi:hypothetical protein